MLATYAAMTQFMTQVDRKLALLRAISRLRASVLALALSTELLQCGALHLDPESMAFAEAQQTVRDNERRIHDDWAQLREYERFYAGL